MKTTITVEIDIEVEFTPIKGYPQTYDEPGSPDEIDDIKFDNDKAIASIEKYLESEEVDGILLEEAYEQTRDYEFEKAEYLYEQKKDAEIEHRYNKEK
jgi:hypothetical protein